MYEVEVKVPADLEVVRTRLDELEATPTGAVVQADTYYDAPHRSFPETDEALRIRTERLEDGPDENRLTYKGPLVDDASKSREEVETAVGDGEKVDAVLTKLGFEPAATVRKERERFALEGYTITLDSVEDVGEYVEVETEVDDESALEDAREGVFDVLERLGLDPDDQLRTSYLELLLESG
ncbi:adenylyl cyclase CyaB [Natronococcus amylolyticus DSM 10524]|uniref:Adenylyl cyclase CyaB n=1 Tax=Natronococcus amylolyticus DSM 10524 TaxID=1227497 RepID=L9XBM2_9EURY|nr:class IV adenylate cyclase [Natronococcus amylolyticus]ELY57993.1 adenylyl cyclase CyaB [Natronococcus amylolyticus DSM 10524]